MQERRPGGRVVAARERSRSALAQYGSLAVLLGATNWLYWSMGGPVGLAVGGTLTLLILRQTMMARSLERAMSLLAAEQLDASEAQLQQLLRRVMLPRLLRARAEAAVHAASSALDGFAWASQATMFLLLGLLVSPHDMVARLAPTLIVAGVLIFVARPLSVVRSWLSGNAAPPATAAKNAAATITTSVKRS